MIEQPNYPLPRSEVRKIFVDADKTRPNWTVMELLPHPNKSIKEGRDDAHLFCINQLKSPWFPWKIEMKRTWCPDVKRSDGLSGMFLVEHERNMVVLSSLNDAMLLKLAIGFARIVDTKFA